MFASFYLLTSILFAQTPFTTDVVRENNFKAGEQLDFKLSYGWFTVGKAKLTIDNGFVRYQGEECYKLEIKGETAGFLGVFTHVDDTWGGYVEKRSLLPLYAYRDIEEGKYIRVERTHFDHDSGKVEQERYDPRKKERKPNRFYDVPANTNDLMSAYLNLRNTDFSKFKKGDTITVKTFYEDELYDFRIVFDGKQLFESKVGLLHAYKVFFLVPPSEVFPNENGIAAWISADKNQLPLSIEAEMFFGTAYCDLISYRNLKYGPDYD
ncbi:MAG: hypothetical protein ACI83W_000632 [Marinoscillum sp.]|jgi:hypothetical protein